MNKFGHRREWPLSSLKALLSPRRGNAYQPRVKPWESTPQHPGVLKERRIFTKNGRLAEPFRCGVPSERFIVTFPDPGFHPGLVCSAPLGRGNDAVFPNPWVSPFKMMGSAESGLHHRRRCFLPDQLPDPWWLSHLISPLFPMIDLLLV
jgi:hypothetical protein